MAKTILFSDNSLWGCLNFRGYIIEKFIEDGYRVVVVAPNNSFVPVSVPESVIYEPIPMSRTGSNPLKDVIYLFKLRQIYKKYQPDIIFHYTIKPNIYGTFAAKMLGIPSVAMITGLGYVFSKGGVSNKIARILYKTSLRFASHVLFLNNDSYQLFLSKRFVISENSTLLRSGEGVDLRKFNTSPPSNNSDIIFLMVARVLYDKGYNEFVEAANANPMARFQLIGAIDTNPEAVPVDIVKNEKSIEYLGFMPREELIIHLQECSCVVLPSYNEGLSIALIEAAAIGKPIICSDIAGCREIVDDGKNGYLVQSKNGEALASACAKFIALSPAQKREMSLCSRHKAECEFDIKTVFETYRKLTDMLSTKC